MSNISRDEIHGVLIQSGDERILLPNSTIAEVTSRADIDKTHHNAPPWMLGYVDWYGWKVPLVSFLRFSSLGQEATGEGSEKIVILKAIGGRPTLRYFALITESFPQLVSISRDALLADASEDVLPRGVQIRVLLGDQHVLVPDLDTIEGALLSTVSQQSVHFKH